MKKKLLRNFLDKNNNWNNLLTMSDSKVIVHAEERKKRLTFYFFIFLNIFTFFLFTISSLLKQNYLLLMMNGGTFLLTIIFLWMLLLKVKINTIFKLITLTIFLFLQFIFFFGGPTGEAALWSFIFPIICIFLNGQKSGLIISLIFLLVTQLNYFFVEQWHGYNYPSSFRLRFVSIYMLLLFFILSYEFSWKQAQYFLARFAKRLKHTIKLLEQRQKQYHTIMNHVSDGLLLLDKNLVIQKNYSRYVEKIFNTKENLAGKNFFDLLKGKTFEAILYRSEKFIKKIIEKAQEHKEKKDQTNKINKKENPLKKVQFNDLGEKNNIKILSFSFSIIYFRQKDFEIMVRIKNITEKERLRKKLKTEKKIRKQESEMIHEVLESHHSLLEIFLKMVAAKDETLKDFQNKLLSCRKEENNLEKTQKNIERVLSVLHSLKGNASISGFFTSAEVIHKAEIDLKKISSENLFKNQKDKEINENFRKKAAAIIDRIHSHLNHLLALVKKISNFEKNDGDSKEMNIGWLMQKTISSYNSTAKKKIDATIDVCGFKEEILQRMEKEKQLLVFDMAVQLVKNSLIHGFNEEFFQKNNPEKPIISLSNSIEKIKNKNNLVFYYTDNGKGINWGKIKDKEGHKLPREEAIKKIFTSCYSLRTTLDIHAGNGLGMAMIKEMVENMGGHIFLPETKQGFALKFIIP